MVTESKTQFSSEEAIEAILNATKDGGLPIEDRMVLLASVLREQQEQIRHLRLHLRDESQINAANTETLRILKALVCKAAWALAMPGATGANHAGFPIGVGAGHVHPILNEDAQQAFADLAALDTSGYAPCEGIAPNGGSNAEHPLYQEGFAAGLASRQAPRMRSLRGSVPS